jgi:hypothetical protein
MSKKDKAEIADLKKRIQALENKIEEIEQEEDGVHERYVKLFRCIETLVPTWSEEDVGDAVETIAYSILPGIFGPEIASYIAGHHIGVSLECGKITGIKDGSEFWESCSSHFERVGFDNFQLGFKGPYFNQNHYLCLDDFLERYLDLPISKSSDMRQFMSQVKSNTKIEISFEQAKEIFELYIYWYSCQFIKE